MVERVKQIYGKEVPREIYDSTVRELEIVREFIKTASVERLVQLESKEKQLAEIEIRHEELNKAYRDLKTETDKRIQQALTNQKRELERVYQAEIDKKVANKQYNMQEKKVKPAERAKEQAEQERDRIKEMADTIKEMYDKQTEEHKEIKDMLRIALDTLSRIETKMNTENISEKEIKQDIIEEIHKTEEEIDKKQTKFTESEKAELHNEIVRLVGDGLTQVDIAAMFRANGRKGFNVSEKTAVRKVNDYYNWRKK